MEGTPRPPPAHGMAEAGGRSPAWLERGLGPALAMPHGADLQRRLVPGTRLREGQSILCERDRWGRGGVTRASGLGN